VVCFFAFDKIIFAAVVDSRFLGLNHWFSWLWLILAGENSRSWVPMVVVRIISKIADGGAVRRLGVVVRG
jgi:hypothetical protein